MAKKMSNNNVFPVEDLLNFDFQSEDMLKQEQELLEQFDFTEVLKCDDEDEQDLIEEKGFLEAVKKAYKKGEDVPQALEDVYTMTMDSYYRMGRRVNPLSTLGKARIEEGIKLRKDFELVEGPLVSSIIKDNAEAFDNLIPANFLEDIAYNRMRGIAVLRRVGSDVYGAGAAVFSWDFSPDNGLPIMRIEHFFVREELRQRGVGDAMMGELMYIASKNNASAVTVGFWGDMNEIIGDFLSEWRFEFVCGYLPEFRCLIGDMRNAEVFKKGTTKAKALSELDATTFKKALKRINSANAGALMTLEKDYFEQDISSYLMDDTGELTGLLLFHKNPDGSIRGELLWSADKDMEKNILSLLRFAFKAGADLYDDSTLIHASIEQEETESLFDYMFTNLQIRFGIEGVLTAPLESEDITEELWNQIKEESRHEH